MNRVQTFNPLDQIPSATLNGIQDLAAPVFPLKGHIRGFNLRSPGDGHLYISPGELLAYDGSAGAVMTTEFDFGAAPATGSQWYYVYVHITAGAINFTISTTGPDAAQRFGATLTNERYLGCYRSQSGTVIPFRMTRGAGGTRYTYRLSARALADFTALSSGTATTWTDVSLATWVPPHARLARLRMALLNTTAAGSPAGELRTKGDTTAPSVSLNNAGVSGAIAMTVYDEPEIETDSSQAIQYQINAGSGTAANAMNLYAVGFTE
jgi:hypothetical protein